MTQGGEEIHCPLRVVDALLRQHAASGAGGVGHDACAGHFARCLSDASALAKVPSLNVTDLNQVPPDTLGEPKPSMTPRRFPRNGMAFGNACTRALARSALPRARPGHAGLRDFRV